MKCEACLLLVEELFDGELEPRLARDVRAHMTSCAPCFGYYESLPRAQDIYNTFLEGVELSPAAWSGLQTRIQEEKIADTGGFVRSFLQKCNRLLVPRFQQTVFAAILAVVVIGIGIAMRFAAGPEDKQQFAGTAGSANRVELQNQAAPAISQSTSAVQNTNQVARVIEEARVGPIDTAGVEGASGSGSSSGEPGRRSAKTAQTAVPGATIQTQTTTRISIPLESEAGRTVAGTTAAADAIFEKAGALGREMESARSVLALNRPITIKTELARNFEKTRLLLLSLKNTEVSESDTSINVSHEKMLSRTLADRNLLLRGDVAKAGNRPAVELLDRVQLLLLEIANLPDHASPAEVVFISRRLASREVIGLLQAQAFTL